MEQVCPHGTGLPPACMGAQSPGDQGKVSLLCGFFRNKVKDGDSCRGILEMLFYFELPKRQRKLLLCVFINPEWNSPACFELKSAWGSP